MIIRSTLRLRGLLSVAAFTAEFCLDWKSRSALLPHLLQNFVWIGSRVPHSCRIYCRILSGLEAASNQPTGYFIRHFSVAALIRVAESLRASGREWPENATYNGGFFDKAMALCESMSKPVIAAISGTCLAGGFEFALSCDLRIAEDGDYLIGLPEVNLGLLPGAGGTQRLPRTIGTPAALMHILMGVPLTPREAERKGLVHETVSGKALDRAMEIAQHLSSHTPESVAYIKRLVRNATETPLAQGLALERNLFLKLCITESALARMRSYEEQNITSPSRSIVIEERA